MESPITISSCSSHNRECPDLTSTVVQDAFNQPKHPIGVFDSPQSAEKVKEWICSMELHQQPVVNYDSDDDNFPQNSFIRYDFQKSSVTNIAKKKQIGNKLVRSNSFDGLEKNNCNNERAKFESVSAIKRPKSVMINKKRKISNGSSDNENLCVGCLSPESHKRQLCMYLKLRSDDSVGNNRRSSRVRNFNQLMEKKKLEKKLNDKVALATSQFSTESTKNSTLRNIHELNMHLASLNMFKNVLRFPPPPTRFINSIEDFEQCQFITEIADEAISMSNVQIIEIKDIDKENDQITNGYTKKRPIISKNVERLSSLRKNKFDSCQNKFDNLVTNRDLAESKRKKPNDESRGPYCEIVTIGVNSDDEITANDFEMMSNEQKQLMIEKQIEVPMLGARLAPTPNGNGLNSDSSSSGDYSRSCSTSTEIDIMDANLTDNELEQLPSDFLVENRSSCLTQPVDKQSDLKSLHRSLNNPKKPMFISIDCWQNSDAEKNKNKIKSHPITISKENGKVLNCFYVDCNLIIVQEWVVSFWTQSPLGNVLGAQNMWIPNGQVQRLGMDKNCVQKMSKEVVVSMENSVAYVELWTKEHISEKRERPVADVFVRIYFWKQRQNEVDKKVLQLENIKGFPDEVQYVVTKYSPKIIVSWNMVIENNKKTTCIRAYHLTLDYQTVLSIHELDKVDHYVASLHNIKDCYDAILGFGDNKITLWNLERGYIVATIELSNVTKVLSTVWVKCDRGFLFIVQENKDNRELCLSAINGIYRSWKKLQNYAPPMGYNRLKGVFVDNGILAAFYDEGILCWNAQSGEPLFEEEVPTNSEYIPSDKYVIIIVDEKVIVRHSMTHFVDS